MSAAVELPALAGLPEQVRPPQVVVDPGGPHEAASGAGHGGDAVEVVAVPVLPASRGGDLTLGPGADAVGAQIDVDLLAVLDAERATGRAGEIVVVPVPRGTAGQPGLRRVLLVGVGAATATDLRRCGAAVARACRDRDTLATSIPALDPDTALEPFVVGLILGSFEFGWRSTPPEHPPVRRAVLCLLTDADAEAVARASAVARAGWQARALAHVPSNLKNPAWLAERAREIGTAAGLGVEVWDESRLRSEGFGGIIGVGQASASPPRLIRLDYTPPRRRGRSTRRARPVVLVGKGITFDSGGLSIKPAEAMSTMKRDMTGGAVVLATMAALDAVGCPVPVIGLVAAAENAVSGTAMRPGDVVRHYGGRTSEVTNTDAEGRLVMADALAYAVAELDPAVLVDVATLTGAIKVALGLKTGGFFANDEALAAAIAEAGSVSGEPLWRMPLAAAYEERLASTVADADNAPGGPGAITAALFLQHFVGGRPWAHLDIASVGDSAEDAFEYSKGPTGFGARALLAWLGSADPLAGIGG